MICPFCKHPASWSSVAVNGTEMSPVNRRALGCSNPDCLIAPSASYEDMRWVGLGHAKGVPGAYGGYIPIRRDAEFEVAWKASQ